MATYKQIQDWVQQKYGYQPKSCWIAHVKELAGLPIPRSPNRQGEVRLHPCPPGKVTHIKDALKHFGML